MLLQGKTAVVTGSARGIGAEIASVFGASGARIVVADIDADAAEARARTLVESGVEAIGCGCDVTDESSVAALVERALKEFASLDVFVNNAGFTRDASMRKMTVEDFLAVIHVHLLGAWLGTRAASQAMRDLGRGGSILNMSSISGKVGNPGQTSYSAAKAGMVGLTKAAAKECARFGVRVNALQPGLIRTAMIEGLSPELLADRLKDIPLGRLGEISDVANAALFLASDLSAYITGTVVEVAGGRHM
ncbi:3-oxoacyl-ACP reductase FabG [Actinopolymorpha alba]|uniref:3-oxoacyl-ACP reductase FabG n=1 Tax=Actinopolymorpha alba TaxID=533267 RepID=UPI000369FDA9|nr:3-oxoacyl-ACP reductase FabG [Actinopolymorpha alba]